MEKHRFQIFRNSDRDTTLVDFTVSCSTVTGAEQNIVLLDDDLHAIAVIDLQPGFDRREVALDA